MLKLTDGNSGRVTVPCAIHISVIYSYSKWIKVMNHKLCPPQTVEKYPSLPIILICCVSGRTVLVTVVTKHLHKLLTTVSML